MISSEDWAYLAGILDGEGSICLHKDKKTGRIWGDMSIYNTSPELINWILEKFGGRIYDNKSRNRFGDKPNFVIRWNGEKSGELIPYLLPYLIIKQKKALNLLALSKVSGFHSTNKNKREEQEMIYEMVRKQTGGRPAAPEEK